MPAASGPPEPTFAAAEEEGLNLFLKTVMTLLSFGIQSKIKWRKVNYSFLFMKADGASLGKITSLVETGIIRPVIERMFPFAAASDALALVQTGRSNGKSLLG
jgi:NADPH:quinone reductase-like Zn-dependent oxidoreductase